MSTITFDSLKLSDRLKSAGFSSEQAETVVRVIAEAQDELVTNRSLEAALAPVRTDLALLKNEISQIKWMLGFVMAGVLAVLTKLLTH